jgi:anti-anti-sigma factor
MSSPSRRVLTPTGHLDSELGGTIRRQVVEATADGATSIVIDMRAVTFMDSAGFGGLIMALKKARESGCHLVLAGIPHQVKLVLELTGTDEIFEIVPADEALETIS